MEEVCQPQNECKGKLTKLETVMAVKYFIMRAARHICKAINCFPYLFFNSSGEVCCTQRPLG